MSSGISLKAIAFKDIPGWDDDDHLKAYDCFRMAQKRGISRPHDNMPEVLIQSLSDIRQHAQSENLKHQTEAKSFFERHFSAFTISIHDPEAASGMITGYFEPEINARHKVDDKYSRPLLRKPQNAVRLDPDGADYPDTLPQGLNAALQNGDQWQVLAKRDAYHSADDPSQSDYFTADDVIAYLDPVDHYFTHIQGSATLVFEDEIRLRVAYAGRNGHPYRSIGKVVIERGLMPRDEVTYEGLVAWLRRNPDLRDEIFAENSSYIFFTEADFQDMNLGPVAAAGVPLTAFRSLAIDRRFHPYHLPIFVSSHLPGQDQPPHKTAFNQLMIAQDTGAAIQGPERGDVFFGRGEAMGIWAGNTQSTARFTLLLPKDIKPEMLTHYEGL